MLAEKQETCNSKLSENLDEILMKREKYNLLRI